LSLVVGDPDGEEVERVVVSGVCERGEETKFVVPFREEEEEVRLLPSKDDAAGEEGEGEGW